MLSLQCSRQVSALLQLTLPSRGRSGPLASMQLAEREEARDGGADAGFLIGY